MPIILTKPTMIGGTVYPIGQAIDGIAHAGEVESLLRVNRAVKKPGKAKPEPEPEPEPISEPEPEPAADPEPAPVDAEPNEEHNDGRAELQKFVDDADLPKNVFEALVEAGIETLADLVEKANQDDYRFAVIKGIGKKTEEMIREALGQ
jgi:fused signal recognition particle receptor